MPGLASLLSNPQLHFRSHPHWVDALESLHKICVLRSSASGRNSNKVAERPETEEDHRGYALKATFDGDLLLGNDFLQQFQDYHQTLYIISLKTPCGHYIKVPRKQNPYNLEKAFLCPQALSLTLCKCN